MRAQLRHNCSSSSCQSHLYLFGWSLYLVVSLGYVICGIATFYSILSSTASNWLYLSLAIASLANAVTYLVAFLQYERPRPFSCISGFWAEVSI